MRPRTFVLFLCSAFLGLAGITSAADKPSEPIPITDPTKRLEFPRFSILPPQGLNWSIFRQGPSEVVFMKAPLATPPMRADRLHTFAVIAIVFDPQGADLESPTGVQEFLERDKGAPPRFRFLESQTVLDSSLGPGCVRFDSVVEERDNPRAPGSALIISEHGFICRHPHVPTRGVYLSYSERYVQGDQSLLSEGLKQEAEASLRSVMFKPVQ